MKMANEENTGSPRRPEIGILLFVFAAIAIISKLVMTASNTGGSTSDLLIFINWASFALFWLITIGWSIASALRKVRFSLGKMMAVIWAGGACVTAIVASTKAEVIALGLFGLLFLTAYLIAGLARAGIGSPPRED
jgi:hypothetical protein